MATLWEFASGSELNKKYSALLDSSYVVNSLPKGTIRTTTVKNFIIESKEEDLVYGDSVTIIANELEYYDLLPEYVEVLADNLRQGVVYNYYIPNSAEIRMQSRKLCEAVANTYDIKTSMQMLNNIHFYSIKFDIIYNFAIVDIKANEKICYWYFAFDQNDDDDNLCIVSFRKDSKKQLQHLLATIQESSTVANIKENFIKEIKGEL